MGIAGLLPFLEKSSKKINIREFSGGTVAIDSYCWLHKGVFSCSEKLMMGQKTNAYVLYCMKYINMLLKYKMKPILVFDGRHLPAKEQTEIKRRESRQMNHRKAIELIQIGQVAEGRNLLKRAIDISHEIALELIKHCQNQNIDCIVAPYEADAQLAYLNISGIADIVITEDSDLTLFGCKKIFFKMDFNGNGVLIEQDRLHLALDVRPEQFSMDEFRYICILSGCDYLPSLPGIGLGKARKFIARNTNCNIHTALTRIGLVLNMKSLVVTQEYRDAFILADITFKHQLVFCPVQRKQVRLNPPTADITEDQLRYAGKELDADLALQLALGNCDPFTLKMVHDFNPDKIVRKRKRDASSEETTMTYTSIWSNKYELKMKNYVSSSENTMNSSLDFHVTSRHIVAGKKLALQRNSPKDEHVSSKLHNSVTKQCNRLSGHENLDENAILDLYNLSQNAKLIVSPEKKSDENLCLAQNNTSPELFRQRNPFVKQVSNLATSPSVLSDRNCRKRGRNLMRMKRTIIDENSIIESKYFSKQDEEKSDVLELENKRVEDVNLQTTKYNVILEMGTNVHDAKTSQEQLKMLSIIDYTENASLMEDINDALSSNRNEYLTNTYENVSDNCLISSNFNKKTTNNFINYENTSTLRKDLSKCKRLNANSCQVSSHKTEIIKGKNSANLVSKVNSATKRKQLPSIPRQQNLLSMYGFQKRPSLKH